MDLRIRALFAVMRMLIRSVMVKELKSKVLGLLVRKEANLRKEVNVGKEVNVKKEVSVRTEVIRVFQVHEVNNKRRRSRRWSLCFCNISL